MRIARRRLAENAARVERLNLIAAFLVGGLGVTLLASIGGLVIAGSPACAAAFLLCFPVGALSYSVIAGRLLKHMEERDRWQELLFLAERKDGGCGLRWNLVKRTYNSLESRHPDAEVLIDALQSDAEGHR